MNNRFDDFDFPEPKTAAKIWAAAERGEYADVAELLLDAGLSPSVSRLMVVAASERKRLAAFIAKHKDASDKVAEAQNEVNIAFASRAHATDNRAQFERENAANQQHAEALNLSEQVRVAQIQRRGIEERFYCFVAPDDERKVLPPANRLPQAVSDELRTLGLGDEHATPWAHVAEFVPPTKAPKRIQSPLVAGGK